MILEIKKTTEIKLDSLEDLQEYKKSMDDNNLKINIAALSRKYKVDRRIINKQQIYDFNSLRFIDKKENIIVVLEKHT